MKVGFLGLGGMGAAMATRLVQGSCRDKGKLGHTRCN